ncbi:DUF2783 domain-containing protein [Pseudomonas vancouverensis]|uniref:DUF2783 domain-containing protein n=1 Tax=Pseudomonas vancouverensis TaxID=95300 RepID=A0A1H2MDX1_PSEVA|nr:DUF2783 domain-containing protein [Pseudomonas vancouverensis]KAB0499141.1 DUF2783 domain-containing protein [Pseudomonas vancouverensis]TDB59877.1 DUF2783 domain-containing protein [Pseudomonas vancouverensis]SDU91430.1 hypothetical protein SAMN05216558_0623 [Pseudomonas vancouverensis]
MNTLSISELETVYDHLAAALDKAPEDKRELFLVKLALLSAEALGDPQRTTALAEIALIDL